MTDKGDTGKLDERSLAFPGGLSRAQAMDAICEIWRLSKRLECSGFRDLEPRAAEIRSMAHYMLYDADAGIEELR